MTLFPLAPQPQAYGYPIGMLLLDLVETHVPGDTANALTYRYPVLFKVVEAMKVERVTAGDPAIEAAVVAAAQELEAQQVKAITSNCGFMLHYQEAVRAAVQVPVFLSSLLQLPLVARSLPAGRKIAILTAFKGKLTPEMLALAGLPEGVEAVVNSIETSPEFRNMAEEDLDTERFRGRLEAAAEELFAAHEGIGALLLECAVFTPYAAALQRRFKVPVYDFISLIDFAYTATNRREHPDLYAQG